MPFDRTPLADQLADDLLHTSLRYLPHDWDRSPSSTQVRLLEAIALAHAKVLQRELDKLRGQTFCVFAIWTYLVMILLLVGK